MMATTTRIPIKLSPHFYGDASTTSSSYHAIHQEASNAHVNLAGSNLLTATNNSGGNSTNNGSNSNTLELNTADGTSLRGHMNNADDHDCVLLYDEASQVSRARPLAPCRVIMIEKDIPIIVYWYY
jgi:hypothetical protein